MIAEKRDTLFTGINDIKSSVSYSNKAIYILDTTNKVPRSRKREVHFNYHFRYVRNRINKALSNQLIAVKAGLIKVIDGLKDGSTEVTKEQHIASKQIITLLKEKRAEYEGRSVKATEVLSMFSEVISLAYDFEKKIRIKLYSNKNNNTKETSPFTKAVSSVSMRVTAKAMYDN